MEREESETPERAHRDIPPRRRWFGWLLRFVGLGYAGVIGYPIYRYLGSAATLAGEAAVTAVDVGKTTELKPNTVKLFRFGSRPGLLLRTAEGELRAFDATCTHLACTVQYAPERELIWCACHGGQYDLSGKNVAGPPPRPLTALKVSVSDAGDIIISRA